MAEKDKVCGELSHMIADLNEVHMKLDALLGKLSSSLGPQPNTADEEEGVDTLRRNFDQQLDRIREKLADRLRSAELAMT